MISRLADLHAWARIVAAGGLLTPATQRERERFPAAGLPGVRGGYGLGLFKVSGWIGHNGSIPGYQSLTVYLPPLKASMVVLLNTDVSYRGNDPSTLFGQAITRIISPQHVFYLPPIPAR
jgi:D-alanyl-D-alanine carboxypeptidase